MKRVQCGYQLVPGECDACQSGPTSTGGLGVALQLPVGQASQRDSAICGRAETGAPLEGVLVDAPISSAGYAPSGTSERSVDEWVFAVQTAPDLQQLAPRLVWGFSRGYVFEGLNLLSDFAKPFATYVATKLAPGVFPLPCDFTVAESWKWPLGDFEPSVCEDAWVLMVAAALNSLHGFVPPFPKRRGGVPAKRCLECIRDRVTRFLSQRVSSPLSSDEVWADVSSKHTTYNGEEIALAQTITLDQIISSLPPLGHGGSVELSPLLEGRTRFLIENPKEVLLGDSALKVAKNTARVHIHPGEEASIFKTLFERGVVDFVPEERVFADSDGKFLSGLFGVPKPGKFTPSGKPVLRLIMNLIPINQALEVILGDISELPSATTWQQLVLTYGLGLLSVSFAGGMAPLPLFQF